MIKKYFLAIFLIPLVLQSQDTTWLTHYESSGFLETPRYDETVEFCQRLADASPFLHYTTFGVSPQGRGLPLLIADRNGHFDPLSVKASGNAVLLVEACIHPGEPEGKDAGLTFLRDLAVYGQHPALLRATTLLFMPIFNVDGHERFGPYNRINQNGPLEMGWRTTSQNLNLNRDFLKADAPEMQAWLRLFNEWLPDLFMDIHTTDGADYQYASTYALETGGNMEEEMTKWTENVYIPYLEEQMEEAGSPVFPYVAFRRWHDPRSGLRNSVAGPRYSQGYTAVQNRIGLLVETHMLKDYKTRVTACYEQIRITCELMEKEAENLTALNALTDAYVSSPAFRKEPMPVDWKPTGDSIMVTFRGVEYDVVRSDLTGGDWFIYHPDKPVTFELPYFREMEPSAWVSLPEAYLIPPQWRELIDRLKWHGVELVTLEEEQAIAVESYRFTDVGWADHPFEGKLRVNRFSYETINEIKTFPAGTVIVNTDQRTAKVIAHLLEPDSPDAWMRWGNFNTVFEQKEYAETYVMEGLAREMFKEDPALEKEFRKMLDAHPDVARNQWSQLNWVYQRSPYHDQMLNVYPVARVVSKKALEGILRK